MNLNQKLKLLSSVVEDFETIENKANQFLEFVEESKNIENILSKAPFEIAHNLEKELKKQNYSYAQSLIKDINSLLSRLNPKKDAIDLEIQRQAISLKKILEKYKNN